MKLRDRFFETLSNVVTHHAGTVLLTCVILTIVLLASATRLGIKTQFADMMPDDIPMIQEYMEIIEDYSSDATVMITIENDQLNLDRMQEVAQDLAARLSTIHLLQPKEDQSLTLGQRFALFQGQFPSNIDYDTLNLVRRIDYKIDREFISSHGMMAQETKDLENMLTMYSSLSLTNLIQNINDNFEKEFIDDSDNITTLNGEEQAVQGLEGISRFLESIDIYLEQRDSVAVAGAIADFITGPQYMISSDNSMLLMMLHPSVSFNEFEEIMYLGYRIDDTLTVVSELYPDVRINRTGLMMMQIDENNALAEDFAWPSVIALGLILILLIGAFKDWKHPLFAVITLMVGILWTAGILASVFRYLNIMSAGFGIVLVGLGIDFGIHFISGFRDGREQGMSVSESLKFMYNRVGAGVITGALTTAIVFFCLQFTRFEAYSQLGISTGIGIIAVLLVQMIMLPALIVWDNKGYSLSATILRKLRLGFLVNAWKCMWGAVFCFFTLPVFTWICRPLRFRFLATSGTILGKVPVAIMVLIVSAVLIVFSVRAGFNMEWEYDFMKLQPAGTPSQITQNNILEKFEFSPDYAMVKAGDLDECRSLVEEFRKIGDRTGLIASVDAITEFIPEESAQLKNAELIDSFRVNLLAAEVNDMNHNDVELLENELLRLHQNIVEIGEMSVLSLGEDNKIVRKCDQIAGAMDEDSYVLALSERIIASADDLSVLNSFQKSSSEIIREKLLSMSNTDLISFETIPESIRERYVNPNNNDLLINIFPRGYIWEEQRLQTFNDYTSRVSERTTGMPAIIQLMMDLMAEKGRDAVIIGSIAILLFLLIDFRSLKFTLLASVPLAVGAVFMVGMMAVTGMKLSIMNFVALPLIIGIGIDDGVHMLHRYRIEGRASVPLVLKTTGRAILLTSLTTMIGFGSMGLASHVGIAMFGLTLFYGVAACFISSAYVLPAVITIGESLSTKKPGKNKTITNDSVPERRKECI
ncbi:MMPL family transporter [Chitinispirillales bacterium ANBcel5]|uniref:efflux RND transporter permease subunit n=1 Tax=Cellulosispirillum alkaliphilum TaxID=3039283 RepID=UPI002A55E955|nr:MMPL family transporter [Chitinispirillales bacterium ANBcel5]